MGRGVITPIATFLSLLRFSTEAKTSKPRCFLHVRRSMPIHTARVFVMSCSVAISSSAYRLGTAASVHPWTSQLPFLNASALISVDATPLNALSVITPRWARDDGRKVNTRSRTFQKLQTNTRPMHLANYQNNYRIRGFYYENTE